MGDTIPGERTLATRRAFEGRLLSVEVLDVELTDGTRSVREIVRHPGAVVVLGKLPDARFVFVRQFRKSIEGTLLEAVAGTLEPGEAPAACARREMLEETGHTVERLRPLGVMVPAPGYTDERLHVFFADVSAAAVPLSPDEGEQIEVCYHTAEEFHNVLESGAMLDAKTVAAWHLLATAGE
jgi:ADP-ribose pyrophosphatase